MAVIFKAQNRTNEALARKSGSCDRFMLLIGILLLAAIVGSIPMIVAYFIDAPEKWQTSAVYGGVFLLWAAQSILIYRKAEKGYALRASIVSLLLAIATVVTVAHEGVVERFAPLNDMELITVILAMCLISKVTLILGTVLKS